jgi:hypothetical protein
MPTRTANLAVSVAAGLGVAALMQLSTPVNAQACAQRPNIMFCGSTSRTGANLYSGAGPYTEQNGCAPNATVQALLITRGGTTAGNGAAWLAYLNAGGQIITEYSISVAVYNEIYGTAYAPPSVQFGNCRDNAMPQVKLNPGNAFWLANNIPVTPAGVGSCGLNDLASLVTGEAPNLTALGASLAAGQTMFAIRAQGGGHLNLLEADWQDNDSAYTNDSKTFMGALISTCGSAAAGTTAVPVNSPWLVAGLVSLLALFGMSFAGRRRTSPRA